MRTCSVETWSAGLCGAPAKAELRWMDGFMGVFCEPHLNCEFDAADRGDFPEPSTVVWL